MGTVLFSVNLQIYSLVWPRSSGVAPLAPCSLRRLLKSLEEQQLPVGPVPPEMLRALKGQVKGKQ